MRAWTRLIPRVVGPTLVCLAYLAWQAPARAAAPEVPAGAYGEGGFDGEDDRVALRLLTDHAVVQPGQTLRVGVLFEIDPGWHIYWRSPGDSGLPTELDWDIDGGAVGPIQWVTPHRFAEADGSITTYGYSDSVLLYAEAEVAGDPGDALQLDVTARFLVCEILCVPGAVALSRQIPVAGVSRPASGAAVALFDAAAAARPTRLATLGLEAQVAYSQSAIRPGDEFTAIVAIGCQGRPGCTPPKLADRELGYAFIPDLVDSVEFAVTGARPHPLSPGDVLIALRGYAGAAPPEGEQRLSGIVGLLDPQTGAPVGAEFELPLPRAMDGDEVTAVSLAWSGAVAEPTAAAEGHGPPAGPLPLGRALLFALLGGLILNLMPCVLPVLAIKVFAMTELAHSSRREVLAHGAAYGAGVVGSMWLLAAAVIALRAGGESIGWGFQFQEPVFVAAISALLVVFALNLFGAFEIFAPTGSLAEAGASQTGPRRSLFEGLLAVVLATPCSAPFLGTAVGFAFAGSTTTIVAIFTAIGVGLAAPFVLVTLVPAWARFIPRSGAWMATLRTVLGFAVLATVVWLLWVMGRLVGPDALAAVLALLVAVAFVAWIFGQLQAARRTLPARAVALVAIVAGGMLLAALPFEAAVPNATGEPAVDGTSPWAPVELERTLAAGQPAFVYFTADWCITCKVNERGTLASEPVRAAFATLGFRVFEGDWTQRNEAIARELARFGKGGVPMYLVYDPDEPDRPTVLPEILTPSSLLAALHAAASGE